MSGADRYADWDAAYVLGSLSAAERQDFEEHLGQCPSCQRAVAELAGMPGLLAQVPAQEALAMGSPDEEALLARPPASLMPVLPGEPMRRKRDWLVPAVAAGTALVLGGLGGYAASTAGGGPERPPLTTATSGTVRLAFSPVAPSAMTAVIDVAPSSAGTVLRVECQYATSGPGGYDPKAAWADYAIWVIDRDGHAELGKTWTARPNRVMHPTVQTQLAPGEIAAVEIRRVDTGQTVMRTGPV
jgi:hypothetical protein